jgi:hypothetical protein
MKHSVFSRQRNREANFRRDGRSVRSRWGVGMEKSHSEDSCDVRIILSVIRGNETVIGQYQAQSGAALRRNALCIAICPHAAQIHPVVG